MNNFSNILVLTIALSGMSAVPCWAMDDFISPLGRSTCPPTPLQICGMQFVAQMGPVGTLLTFTLPDRFQTRDVSVQCVSDGKAAYYRVINGTATCALKTCDAGRVTLCDTAIPVQEKRHVGDVVKVMIPAELLVKESGVSLPTFTARCAMSGDVAQYEVENDSGVSCNAFLCKPAKLDVCGSSVSLADTAKLGTIFHLTTANQQPVTVQCLATNGHAPQYIVAELACGR